MSNDLLLGKVVSGKYRIEKLLGQGGMGAVYRGTHESLKIPIAVKFLSMGGPSGSVDGSAAARFEREAQTAAKLSHPNIVRVMDFGHENDLYFLVMELLAGSTLTSLIEVRGALPPTDARRIGHQVAAALAHAHREGIVHRDVKPDNVMVRSDGTATLTDFGIAAMTSTTTEKLTRQGNIVGTPWYLAPEQATGGAPVDARADIYALGVMLYEMLTAHLPFEGENPMQQMLARLTQDPIPMRTWRNDLPADLVTLVGRMLARRPDDRIQTADDVAAALGATYADRTVAPPMPMAATAEANAVTARTSELTSMVTGAGLPFAAPPGAHMLDLRLADIRATLRLAEEESADGASLLAVHRMGAADVIAFVGRRGVLSMRVQQGIPSPLPLGQLVARAMERGDGALVVHKLELATVESLRCWLDGPPALQPIPAEILRPIGLFERLKRTRTSGVLCVTDRGQTSLVRFQDGDVRGLLSAPVHRPEIATETAGGISVWIESCSAEAMVAFKYVIASPMENRVSIVPDESLRAVLAAVGEVAKIFAADANKEFGLGSAQVISKSLRQSTATMKDVVPVAAVSGQNGPIDVNLVWQTLERGATTGRDMAVRAVSEALLAGVLGAAKEIVPEKKLAKTKQAALAAAFKAKAAMDAIELSPVVQKLLS